MRNDHSMTTTVLDPTAGATTSQVPKAERLASLDGAVVALLDISKPRGDVFLNRVSERLAEHGATVKRFTKPTFARVAPLDLRQEIASQCDAVIEALAD